MQIVRIFPNNKHKCHFSIRKLNNKFFVYEGDKVLRTDLPSVNSAETEISLIVLNRKKSGATEIPIKYGDTILNHQIENNMPEIEKKERNHSLTPMNCATCEKPFMSKRSNHLTCSRQCSIKCQAKKKALKKKSTKADEFMELEPIENKNSYQSNPSIEIQQAFEKLNTFKLASEDLNEFHELTEKQMRLSDRKKRVNQMATTFVDYVLTWSEVNKSFNNPQSFNILFNDLVNYKIFDLTKIQLFRVFSRFFTYENGTISINRSVNYFTFEHTVETQKKLVDLIYEEDIIPTDEQISKCSILTLMLSQLYFIKKQQLDVQTKNYEIDFTNSSENIEKKLDSEIISGLLDMINAISKQNVLVAEKVDLCLEKQNATIQLLIQNTNNASNDLFDLKICLEKMTKQVEEITKKRRGFFG
jgi:hypothetical protein